MHIYQFYFFVVNKTFRVIYNLQINLIAFTNERFPSLKIKKNISWTIFMLVLANKKLCLKN